MSPKGGSMSRRRRNALIGGASGVVGAAVIALIAIAQTGGNEDLIPPQGGVGDTDSIRIDLLASRDLDTTTPCDLPAGGANDKLPLVSDQTWTRTGGSSCYPISATAAQCFDATEVPYTVDATGTGWAVEPGAINRVLYNTAIDCTNWTCGGTSTATHGKTAPDGSATATELVLGAAERVTSSSMTLYSDGVTLYPRIWVKCSTGTLTVKNSTAGIGEWDIDCSVIGGDWTLINSASQAAVTEDSAWAARTGSADEVRLFSAAGVTASVWAPTLTEESGTGLAVIPTAASAVSTGDISWTIDNGGVAVPGGNYWQSGDTVTQTLTEISGTCWVADATELLLSGAAGSECSGVWYGLQVQ